MVVKAIDYGWVHREDDQLLTFPLRVSSILMGKYILIILFKNILKIHILLLYQMVFILLLASVKFLKKVFCEKNLKVNQSIYFRRNFLFRFSELYNHLEIVALCDHWILEVLSARKQLSCGGAV